MSESTALVNYEEQLRQELGALSRQIEAPSGNKISTKGKVFTLPGGKSGPGPISVVVLDWVAVNMIYKGAYNPKAIAPPTCWAINKNLDELKPSATVKVPESIDCATCPKNQFGSAPNGGKGKACKNQRKLLVVPADFTDKSEAMTLLVSPMGLKSWNSYVNKLSKDMGKLPIQVSTLVTFDANQEYPALVFDFDKIHANVEVAMKLRARYQDVLLKEPEQRGE